MIANKRKAFSLVELVIVVAIIGVFSAIAVPRLNYGAVWKKKADATARKIVTDLRRTRSLAISQAATNTVGFSLNMLGGGPYTSYQIKNLDTSTVIDTLTIDSNSSCNGGTLFKFGPLGNLLSGSDTQLTVSASGKIFTITVTQATGMVECSEN